MQPGDIRFHTLAHNLRYDKDCAGVLAWDRGDLADALGIPLEEVTDDMAAMATSLTLRWASYHMRDRWEEFMRERSAEVRRGWRS